MLAWAPEYLMQFHSLVTIFVSDAFDCRKPFGISLRPPAGTNLFFYGHKKR